MEALQKQVKNPLVVGIIFFIIGAIFGLVVLGWWVWPVEWTDASPEHLSLMGKEEYMRMAIELFSLNGNAEMALSRYQSLGADAEVVLSQIQEKPGELNPEVVNSYHMIVTGGIPSELPEPSEEPSGEGRSNLIWLIPLACLVILILAAVLAYFFIFRGKTSSKETQPSTSSDFETPDQMGTVAEFSATPAEMPISQYMATYKIGDDLFDDSFSIDSASGEFLGECGVGISETIGIGDPKKVTAFEVWLFDKNDIQTVTKVVMSSHAYYDGTTRQRLEAKGEPVLAEPGVETVLETQTLQLGARIVDMSYGEGAMPEQSYFEHITLEITVWSK